MTLGTHYQRYDAERDQLSISTSFGVHKNFRSQASVELPRLSGAILVPRCCFCSFAIHMQQIESGMSGSMHFASEQFAKHFSGHITAGKTC